MKILKKIRKYNKTIFLVSLIIIISFSALNYRKRGNQLEHHVKEMIQTIKFLKKENKSIRETILDRTDKMITCENNFKKLKIACHRMRYKCFSLLRECDDIILKKKNCRSVKYLQRCH